MFIGDFSIRYSALQIQGDEAPGVLVLPTNGGTSVIEPTDLVKLGTGQVLETATTNTSFKGDFGTSVIYETKFHSTLETAQDLELGKWNRNYNPEVDPALTPDAHITIKGTGDGTRDYYSFMGTAGKVVRLDIDHGFDFGDQTSWYSKLTLYGPNGTVAKLGDGFSNPTDPTKVGTGSSTLNDDYL